MSKLIDITRSPILRYIVGLVLVAAALLLIYPNLAKNLFTSGTDLEMFMSHGYCYFWVPSLVVLHVASDSIIGLSYVAISVTLAYLVHRARRDIPFNWVFLAFGLFIVACGATHFMEVITVWHATYWLSGYVKLITAVASLATAVVLPTVVPKILGTAVEAKKAAAHKLELERINRELTNEIAKREQTERALRDSEERFQEFMKYAPTAAFIKQSDGRMVYINPSFERTFGVKAEDIYGKNDFELWSPETAQTLRDNDVAVLESNQVSELYETTLTKEGAPRHWLSFKFPIKNAAGERFLAGMALDITERRRAEEELKNFAARLERSNTELQDFASVASHDLQEPLRKVQAFGDRLKVKCGDALNDEGRDYLERMLNASGRMQTLINDLLTFSRVTIQAKPFAPVNLRRIADEVLSDLETLVEKTKGTVEVDELATIDADPTQMRQLFQNLIGNALKFHHADVPPQVKISGQIVSGGDNPAIALAGMFYRLTVQDNGIGFDNKNAEKIFKVFQRLHGRSEYDGTGIGLAVCRRIAERHGGTITAQSTPNEGAAFTVYLPVKHQEQPKNE